MITSFTTNAFAIEYRLDSSINTYSYDDLDGNTFTIEIDQSSNTESWKLYVNGILTQHAVGDKKTKTVHAVIYDLPSNATHAASFNLDTQSSVCGFTATVTHMPVSTNSIATPTATVSSINEEPVDNTGLTQSTYGDGYYFLGSHGGYYYAPTVYGDLFRTYTQTYDGETKRWAWDEGAALSVIGVALSLAGIPTGAALAILGALVTVSGGVLAYAQAIDLATYTFDYHYKVRVYGTVYFTTERNITYWEIYNRQTGVSKWEEKSFNWGFSMANSEMVKCGVDEYLASV